MEITFRSRELRAICSNPSVAINYLGTSVSEKLKRRLADIAALKVVADLFHFPGNMEESATQYGVMMLEFAEGWCLQFKSSHPADRTLPTGEIDWARVRRIKILSLEEIQ